MTDIDLDDLERKARAAQDDSFLPGEEPSNEECGICGVPAGSGPAGRAQCDPRPDQGEPFQVKLHYYHIEWRCNTENTSGTGHYRVVATTEAVAQSQVLLCAPEGSVITYCQCYGTIDLFHEFEQLAIEMGAGVGYGCVADGVCQ